MDIKPLIKTFLYRAMSEALARPVYAMANRLSKIPHTGVRSSVLYDAMISGMPTPLMYTKSGAEHFVIDTRDKGGTAKKIFAEGEYDFFDVPRTLQLLKENRIYNDGLALLIDVGANIGPICIPAVARGYARRAIAIEPEPHNCRLLRANIALNGLTETISVCESACGMFDNETLDLELSEDNLGDHQIRLNGLPADDNQNRCRIQIPSSTLDALCPIEPGESTLIWMDTQGYEGHVLAGAERWLAAKTPLVMEFDPHLMKRVDSFKLMRDALADYRGFYDLWRNPDRFRPINDLDKLLIELITERESGATGFTNILVIGS